MPRAGGPGRAALGPGLRSEESGPRSRAGQEVPGAGAGPALAAPLCARGSRGVLAAKKGPQRAGPAPPGRTLPGSEHHRSLYSTSCPPRALLGAQVQPLRGSVPAAEGTNKITEQRLLGRGRGFHKTAVTQTTGPTSLGQPRSPQRGGQLSEQCTLPVSAVRDEAVR